MARMDRHGNEIKTAREQLSESRNLAIAAFLIAFITLALVGCAPLTGRHAEPPPFLPLGRLGGLELRLEAYPGNASGLAQGRLSAARDGGALINAR